MSSKKKTCEDKLLTTGIDWYAGESEIPQSAETRRVLSEEKAAKEIDAET